MRLSGFSVLCALALLTACGGGGTSAPVPPTPVGGASSSPTLAPSSAPTLAPTNAPTATPSSAPIADSTSAPFALAENPADGGSASTYGVEPNAFYTNGIDTTQGNAPVDGLMCDSSMATLGEHVHLHLTIYDHGQRVVTPTAVGIYHGAVEADTASQGPYFYNTNPSDPTSCVYPLHMHAEEGMVHVESPIANQQFTWQQFFDIWGIAPTVTGFGPFSGTVRLFETDESSQQPGTYIVHEVTGTPLSSVAMQDRHELTIEIGPPFVQIPNYTFSSSYP